MALEIADLNVQVPLPEMPDSLPVFIVRAATLDERQRALEVLTETLDLHDLRRVQTPDSLLFLGESGEIEFFPASGAIWARNLAVEGEFENEERNWNIVEETIGDEVQLVLPQDVAEQLAQRARMLLESAELWREEAHLFDVSVEQCAELDEEGTETRRFAGKALVRYLYRLEGIQVAGPGAKSYVYALPGDGEAHLIGAFHAWRDVVDARSVRLPSPEEALRVFLVHDGELVEYHEKGHHIEIQVLELVYLSLPAFQYQDYVFPALRVQGSVTDPSAEGFGFEFARFHHVVTPEAYSEAELYAPYLASRL